MQFSTRLDAHCRAFDVQLRSKLSNAIAASRIKGQPSGATASEAAAMLASLSEDHFVRSSGSCALDADAQHPRNTSETLQPVSPSSREAFEGATGGGTTPLPPLASIVEPNAHAPAPTPAPVPTQSPLRRTLSQLRSTVGVHREPVSPSSPMRAGAMTSSHTPFPDTSLISSTIAELRTLST
ncbi:hypothetical protein EON66_05450, partial [archaeon]